MHAPPHAPARLLALALIALAPAACGVTARDDPARPDAAIEIPCETGIAFVSMNDPCEARRPYECCDSSEPACAHFDDPTAGVCIDPTRRCFLFRDCEPGQRCQYHSTTNFERGWCTVGGTLEPELIGMCVPNPRPTLCFDRCAKWRSRADCCAQPDCGWQHAFGLCLSSESSCTEDPTRCGPGMRCELVLARGWGGGNVLGADGHDCGPALGDKLERMRGFCTPRIELPAAVDACAVFETPAACCEEPGCGWHHHLGVCASDARVCTSDQTCAPEERCKSSWTRISSAVNDCGESELLSYPGLRGLCLPPSLGNEL